MDAGKSMPVTKINASTDLATAGLSIPDGCNEIWGSDNFLAVAKNQTIYLRDARDLSELGIFSVDERDGFIEDIRITEKTLYVSVFNFFNPKASTFLYQFDIAGKNLKEKIEFPGVFFGDFLVSTDQIWTVGYSRTPEGSMDVSKLWNFSSFDLREKAKAAAELKARQEAEAKASAELKAKQEAEAKAATDKAATAIKKSTITCIKGKLTKKVTAVKPVCPAGYKKK